jgi:hypothetical protein
MSCKEPATLRKKRFNGLSGMAILVPIGVFKILSRARCRSTINSASVCLQPLLGRDSVVTVSCNCKKTRQIL